MATNGATQVNKYYIFDAEASPVSLISTSNFNIRKVCEVMTAAPNSTKKERRYYDELGEVGCYETEGMDRKYKWEIRYPTNDVFYAGLAEVLFYGCPKMLRYDSVNDLYVADDKEKIGHLIRSEVYRGLTDFFSQFGKRTYQEEALLGFLPKDLITVPLTSDKKEGAGIMTRILRDLNNAGDERPQKDSTSGS